MDLDTRLKRLRRKKKVTREVVASATDIPLNLYIKYEKGTLYPLRKDLTALATYYEIEVDELTGKKYSEEEMANSKKNKRYLLISFASTALLSVIAFTIMFTIYIWEGFISIAALFFPGILAFSLLVAFNFILFILEKSKKVKFFSCLATNGTLILIFVLAITINLGAFKNKVSYSKENWLTIENKYKYYVLKDFLDKYDLKKLNREEVDSYLGNPDILNPGADDYVYYIYEVYSPVRSEKKGDYRFYIDFKGNEVVRFTLK